MLSIYDPSGKYSQHAGVTITSVFEHTKSKIIVHILHDDTLTEDNRRNFMRTAEKYSQAIDFIDVSEYKKRIGNGLANLLAYKFTVGTLYKVIIHDVVKENKVIYLDCDVLVNLDIKELWEIDPGNNYVAAAFDEGIVKARPHSNYYFNCEKIGTKASAYFNAGILVMNLKKIREDFDFFNDAIQWLKRHPHIAPFADQDILNALFAGSVKFIDQKFNRQREDEDLSGSIIHMILCKPWNVPADSYVTRLYWKMYLCSAWGENVTTLSEATELANKVLEGSIYFHDSLRLCRQRISKIAFHIHNVHYPYMINVMKYYVLDVFYWLKYKFSH